MLSKYGKANGWSMAFFHIISLGAWVFGVIIVCMINLTKVSAKKWEAVPIGSMIVLLLLVIFKCFPKNGTSARYRLGISMSSTRWNIIRAELFWEVLLNGATVIVLLGLYHLEMFLYPMVFPGASVYADIGMVFKLAVLPGGIALFTVLPLFAAAMWEFSRWITYILWLCVCFCPSLFSSDRIKASFLGSAIKGFENYLLDMSAYGIGLILLGISAVLLLMAVGILGRQDVKL